MSTAITTRGGSHRRLGPVLVVGMLAAALLPASALAIIPPVIVTAATGGGAISVDKTTAAGGTGAYTALTGPVITENVVGAIGNGTIILTVPAGFEFNAGSGSIAKSPGGCDLTVTTVSMTTTTATVTVSGSPSTVACTFTYSGLSVRPTGTGLVTGAIGASGTATGLPSVSYGALAVVPGAPILTFTTQPGTPAISATAFSPQPKVHAADQYGHVRVGDSVVLTIKAGTGTAGATLTCTAATVVTDGSGDAQFAGCKIDKAGTGYILRATDATSVGTGTADSSALTITFGTAAKLAFVTQPALGVPNTAFLAQPVVTVQDAAGNTVTSSTATIALTLTTNPGSGTLVCNQASNQLAASGGFSVFTGCRINNVGVGYQITAASGGLTSAVSTAFDVADRLAFTTQPTGAVAGTAFTTQPVVAVRAGASTTSTNNNATVVTLSIKAGTGTAGATLTCDQASNQKTAVLGVAAFTGCKIDKISPTGNPYILIASATNLTSAESTSFAVVAGAPVKLGFTSQPASGVASQAFTTQPVVAVQDAGGNTVTTGPSSTATITLGIGTNPGGGTLTCTGGLSKVAVAGVATFSGCQINNAGVGYTLVASATSLTSATSTAFTVTAPGAVISLTTSASVITWGQAVVLTVQFGLNGGSKTFDLQGARDGVTWVSVASPTTDVSGRATFVYRPATNLYYRVVFAGTPDLSAATSATVRTVVRQIAILRPTSLGHVTFIPRNRSVTFTTTTRPARPELVPPKVTFWFYRLDGRSLVLVGKRDVIADSLGRSSTTWKFSSGGLWYVRSAANPTPYNANSMPTAFERYSVS